MTFFSKAKYRFQPIAENKRIETYPFLQASHEIVPFFGEFLFINLLCIVVEISSLHQLHSLVQLFSKDFINNKFNIETALFCSSLSPI